GGIVQPGTVQKGQNLAIRFEVTDGNRSVPVAFTGILPDLFREGQGVVTEGKLDGNGLFVATSVLAKHDEKYVPKEVADALKKQGNSKRTSRRKNGRGVRPLRGGAGAGSRGDPVDRGCAGRQAALRHADGGGGAGRVGAVRFRRRIVRGADRLLCGLGFLGHE